MVKHRIPCEQIQARFCTFSLSSASKHGKVSAISCYGRGGWTGGDNIVVLKGVGSAARGFIGQFFQQLMYASDSAAT